MIRGLLKRDQDRLREIHSKFYANEFPLSDLQNFLCSFVVTDDNDRIITAGGVKTIVEAIIVTDKSASIEARQKALLDTLTIAGHTTKSAGYDLLHVFVQDDKWIRHLIKHGFQPTVGRSLVIGV